MTKIFNFIYFEFYFSGIIIMKRKNSTNLYGTREWELTMKDPKKLDIPEQFAQKLTEPRTLGEINAARLYQNRDPGHYMDSHTYNHPVPPLKIIGLGQAKPNPRACHTIADQLRLELSDAKLCENAKSKLNSLDPHQVQFLENLQDWQNKKTIIRPLDENEQYALLRLIHVQMEKTAAEQFIINTLVDETIALVESGDLDPNTARACRTLARIRNIQHRTTACMNDFLFSYKHISSEKRLNSLLHLLKSLPTAKAHKVEDRQFVKGLALDTIQETKDVLRRIDKAKRQKLTKNLNSAKSNKAKNNSFNQTRKNITPSTKPKNNISTQAPNKQDPTSNSKGSAPP